MHPSYDRLPAHWKKWVDDYASSQEGRKFKGLGTSDFAGKVKINFQDGSFVFFEYAFYGVDEERQEIAVFTEHCGYHIFPLSEETYYSYQVWGECPGDLQEE